MSVVVIAVGGALGAVSRYGAGTWVQNQLGPGFPWGTMTVNVVGSLLLGFAVVWLHSTVSSDELREFIAIGFLGSFTTFSTFSSEALTMLRVGDWWRMGAYTVGSVALGIVAVAAGAMLATALGPGAGAGS